METQRQFIILFMDGTIKELRGRDATSVMRRAKLRWTKPIGSVYVKPAQELGHV